MQGVARAANDRDALRKMLILRESAHPVLPEKVRRYSAPGPVPGPRREERLKSRL